MKNNNKNNQYDFDNILDDLFDETYNELSEEDFYPPSDNRVWKSYVEDIEGGDNFADYCEYIFELYEEEEKWYR